MSANPKENTMPQLTESMTPAQRETKLAELKASLKATQNNDFLYDLHHANGDWEERDRYINNYPEA